MKTSMDFTPAMKEQYPEKKKKKTDRFSKIKACLGKGKKES